MKKIVLIASIILILVLGVGFVVRAGGEDDSVVASLVRIIEKLLDKEKVSNNNSMGYNAQYSDVVVTKLIDMDDIVTTGVDVTNQVTGDFIVDNIIIETNNATIASGTNFRIITSGDAYGTSTVLFDKPINCMARASAWDLNVPINGTCAVSATSTQRVVLEDGSKLIALCTTADCKKSTVVASGDADSTGYVRVTTTLKRASEFSYTFE
jgi:hypothetical protein